MKKIETIWHHILQSALAESAYIPNAIRNPNTPRAAFLPLPQEGGEGGQEDEGGTREIRKAEDVRYMHTQKGIAGQFGFSISTVHHALNAPTSIGAIRKEGKFFVLQDFRKLLYYWASARSLERDIIARAFLDAPVREREGLAPPGSVFGGYTAAAHHLGEPPADYDAVHLYIPEADLVMFAKRYGEGAGDTANVFALRKPEHLPIANPFTTIPWTFVDLWNLRDWYAKDCTTALEEHMSALLSPT